MMIRPAIQSEAELLTEISFRSKGHWGYPKAYFDIWLHELTVSADYILKNDVFVFEGDGKIVGYYSIVELADDIEFSGAIIGKGFWLEHMFVLPRSIGQGVGTQLFNHMLKRCASMGIDEVGILADPNSCGFYERMGCEYISDYPSTIKDRTTPYYTVKPLSFNLEAVDEL